MQSTDEFNGLGMPVFTAFGWAGEETAIKYALSQLELFIQNLHAALPTGVKSDFPYFGLSKEGQGVYLAASEAVEDNIHIAFYARPTSLELQLALINKEVLNKGLKRIDKDPVILQRYLRRLGPDWALRVQQVHINEENGEQGHYQDVYKDNTDAMDEETAVEVFNKAAYLNNEGKWVTPIFISQRIPAEQASAMGKAIIKVMLERLDLLLPVINMLSGRSPTTAGKSAVKNNKGKSKAKTKRKATAKKSTGGLMKDVNEIIYTTDLKPLHLRKGFINMTPQHWPFFAINARTETRDIILLGNSIRDTNSAIWRLQPSNSARVVLSPRAHIWMEDNFVANDRIQITATKINDKEIQVLLEAVD